MKDIWIFLFTLGIVLFGWPIISIFGQNISTYFFLAWIVFIFFIFIATRYRDEGDDGG